TRACCSEPAFRSGSAGSRSSSTRRASRSALRAGRSRKCTRRCPLARDDWRIRIDLPEETRLFDIPLDLRDEASELVNELKGQRLAVSRDGDTLFVYTPTRLEAEAARRIVEAV